MEDLRQQGNNKPCLDSLVCGIQCSSRMGRKSLWYMGAISLTYDPPKTGEGCGRYKYFCKGGYIIPLSVFIILGGPSRTNYVLGHVTYFGQ